MPLPHSSRSLSGPQSRSAPQAWSLDRERGRCSAGGRSAGIHGRQSRRLYADFPPPLRCRSRTGRRRRRAHRYSQIQKHMTRGPPDGAVVSKKNPSPRQARAAAMRSEIRHSSRATIWWKQHSMPLSGGKTSSPSRNCWKSSRTRLKTGPAWGNIHYQPVPKSASCKPSAEPDSGLYCVLRKQIFSPSSRYSAEQTSPPQIIVSPPVQLPARDQPHGSAARTRHDGHVRVLRMTQLGLVFQDENRSGVHSFGNPFFQKLQVG